MKDLVKNEGFKILKYIFITVSIISILYATFTMRGLYNDGTYFMINILNNLANSDYTPVVDNSHPRQIMLILMQIPVWIFNLLHLNGKNFLIYVFSFTQFFLPLIVLYWDYKLSQRTDRPDIFFWHLLVYSLILLPCSIFSVVESIIGAGLSFVLWNYLSNDIEYKITDVLAVTFLLICMFGTYEYVIVLGLIFFVSSIKYMKNPDNIKSKCIKMYIGIVSLLAAFYNLFYIFNVKNNGYELVRFYTEAGDFSPKIFQLCSLISIFSIILLVVFKRKNEIFTTKSVIILYFLYIIPFAHLLMTLHSSLIPIYECHFRTIVCWALPFIFLILAFSPKKNEILQYRNFIIIVLICGIFQTYWQLVNTYFWHKNIVYLKNELNTSKESLYIPEEHYQLSNTTDSRLYRYIWHGTYPAISILLSENYTQKTLLGIYEKSIDLMIPLRSDSLFVSGDKLSIPALKSNNFIDIKNKYWDLSNCTNAVNEYNILKKNFKKQKNPFVPISLKNFINTFLGI